MDMYRRYISFHKACLDLLLQRSSPKRRVCTIENLTTGADAGSGAISFTYSSDALLACVTAFISSISVTAMFAVNNEQISVTTGAVLHGTAISES